MPIYRIDPLHDHRWSDFVHEHRDASIFHTREWLCALQATYGYEPIAYTSAKPGGALTNAIVFCQVKSFLTGSRLVSVPFADHCDALVNSPSELRELFLYTEQLLTLRACRYLELRCLKPPPMETQLGSTVYKQVAHHVLDLRPCVENLFRGFHKSCIQRKIRRAERERLTYTEGTRDEHIRHFYRLLVLTRKRHGLPPQPLAWFFNLRDSLGSAFKVRLVSKDGRPIAGIVTTLHKKRMVYKYGASEARFHSLGAMPFLFWQAIQEAKARLLL